MDRYVFIAIGGALGAIARFQVASMIQSRLASGFPWGTLVVNVSGCFAMGVVTTLLAQRAAASPNWRFLVPIGFIGAYTTFSTFEFETFRAVGDGAMRVALGNVLVSVVIGYAALWLGVIAGRFVQTGA